MNNNPSPEVTDDFDNTIHGIGPAIERHLHQAGIGTFAQLAAKTPLELAALVPGRSAEQIAHEDWTGQAREQAPVPIEAATKPGKVTPGNRQFDASFTIRLLLNEDHTVRYTQVVDNHNKAVEQWADKWDEHRMIAIIRQGAALRLPTIEPTSPVAVQAEPKPTGTVPAKYDPATRASLSGTLHSQGFETLSADTNTPRCVLHRGLSFRVRLHLDLTEVVLPNDDQLECTATVYAKRLGDGPREVIGELCHTFAPRDDLTILVGSRPLPQGSYRLDAIVTLSQPTVEPATDADLRHFVKGGVIEVY